MPEHLGSNMYRVHPSEGIISIDGIPIKGVVKVYSDWPEFNLVLLQTEYERKLEVQRDLFFQGREW